MKTIITNSSDNNLKEELIQLASQADKIDIAVAFFSDNLLLKKWAILKKKITLIVSLRPPTNYFALKDIQSSHNIETNFLGKEFHSKFVIFYKNSVATAAVLGSSNFTSGGLVNNTETNIFIADSKALSELQAHFKDLLQESNSLQPIDLDNYESIYKNFLARQKEADEELEKFNSKTTKNRTKRKQKVRVTKEASQYFEYWKMVDEIKDLVKNICDKEYPTIPYYLALDHFWHYIKVYWHKQTGKTLNRNNQKTEIPRLFSKYIKWHREVEQENYPKHMASQSKKVFQVYLSEKNIDKLNKTQAKEIFQNLHSSGMPMKRFNADDLFIKENDIQKIRMSWKYLLYSNDEMDLKIHNLLKNPKYKLQRFGSSGVQEISGWTNPTAYPIRNDKADKAVEILGYNFA